MIAGIHLDFDGQELIDHCEDREGHHRERAAFYRARIADLEGGGVTKDSVTGDPITSLEKSAESHESSAVFFELLAAHLNEAETYRLDKGDLRTLEYTDRAYHWWRA